MARRNKGESSGRIVKVTEDDWIPQDDAFEHIPQSDFGPRRFWLAGGDEKEIVFLDGDGLFAPREPFPYYEHNMKIDGRWDHFETCVSGKRDGQNLCFLCSKKMRGVKTINRSYIGAFTVIVTTPYTIKKGRRKGETIRNTKMLFCAKPGALKLLKRQRDKHEVLTGAKFVSYRTDGDAPNTGNSFELVEHVVDKDWVLKMSKKGEDGFEAVMDKIAENLGIKDAENVGPYDYRDLFKPKTWEELESEYGFLAKSGGQDSEDEDGPDYE